MLRLPQNPSSHEQAQKTNKGSSNNNRQDAYTPPLRLAFGTIRYFFLFSVGFAVAYVFFGLLHATDVVDALQALGKNVLPLAGILTFSIFSIVVFTESCK